MNLQTNYDRELLEFEVNNITEAELILKNLKDYRSLDVFWINVKNESCRNGAGFFG